LCAAGALLLSFAGAQYALGAVRADRARSEWDARRAADAVARARAEAGTHPLRGALVEGAPVARILIPKIGLDEIVLEGVEGNDLNAGPGHVPGSALPGEAGNAVISAHRDRHFNHFDRLAIGDTVITESDAARTTWVVTARRVIDKDSPALFQTSDATLTLTTCWPIRYFGPAPERLILTAKPVR
jgi:sortase A